MCTAEEAQVTEQYHDDDVVVMTVPQLEYIIPGPTWDWARTRDTVARCASLLRQSWVSNTRYWSFSKVRIRNVDLSMTVHL
ncbi:hypothetical protein J6590_035245 [Homalodisca vitripennis]|nr:hypothetical protein J6590_035245 [Homalodisca vitripennis]